MAGIDIYNKALSFLSLREHSEKELVNKLRVRGYENSEIEKTIATLKEDGNLSDKRMCEVFILSRLNKRAEGKRALLMRLLEKGIDREIATNALDKAWEDKLYLPILKRDLERYAKKYGKEKALYKLREKGFSSYEIREAEDDDE